MKRTRKNLNQEPESSFNPFKLIIPVVLLLGVVFAMVEGPKLVETVTKSNQCQTLLDYSGNYRATTDAVCRYSCVNATLSTEIRSGGYKDGDIPKNYEEIAPYIKKDCKALCSKIKDVADYEFAKYMNELGCIE